MAGQIFRTVFAIIIVPFKILTFGVFGLLVNTTMRHRPFTTLKFKIPFCRNCRTNQIPKMDWADFEEGTMSFIVPKQVADIIKDYEGAISDDLEALEQ